MRFDRFGLRFDYPDDWALDIDADVDGDAGVTVLSPGGGLWSVMLDRAASASHGQADAVAAQMRLEYDDLEADPAVEQIEGRSLSGYDFHFISLDLTVTATVRVLAAGGTTYVVFCQADDREWDEIAPVFAAMTTSLVRGLPPR
ncbi:MAG: hypothetical protein ACKO5R_12095 [Planctomycetaceae bacterium]